MKTKNESVDQLLFNFNKTNSTLDDAVDKLNNELQNTVQRINTDYNYRTIENKYKDFINDCSGLDVDDLYKHTKIKHDLLLKHFNYRFTHKQPIDKYNEFQVNHIFKCIYTYAIKKFN